MKNPGVGKAGYEPTSKLSVKFYYYKVADLQKSSVPTNPTCSFNAFFLPFLLFQLEIVASLGSLMMKIADPNFILLPPS